MKRKIPDTDLFDVDIHGNTHHTLAAVWFGITGGELMEKTILFQQKSDVAFLFC